MSVRFPRVRRPARLALVACLGFGLALADPAVVLSAVATCDTSVAMTDAPDPVDPGNTITWTLTASNAGPFNAANTSVTDTLPAGLLFVSAIAPPGWTCTTPAVGANGTITCSFPSFAPGNATLLYSASVDPAALGGTTYTNAATIGTTTLDTNGANQSASTDTTVNFIPGMTVVKTLTGTVDNDRSTTVTVGDELDYQVSANNTGNGSLSSVFVDDDHFAATTGCRLVPVGGSCVLTGSYIVTAADETARKVVNTGRAISTEVPGPLTDSVTTAVVLVPAPAMSVVKALTGITDNDSSTTVSEGDQLDYQVTATNTGNIPLTSVHVSDDHFAATQDCSPVLVGASCILTGSYIVQPADTAANQVVNTGTATSKEAFGPFSDQTTTGVFFVPAPAMTLDKVLAGNADNDRSASVSEGDVLTYTVTATDSGNTAITNLQIDDAQLSPTTTICAGLAPGGTCVLSGTHAVTHAEALAQQVVNQAQARSVEVPGPILSPSVVTPVPAVNGMALVKTFLGSQDLDGSGDVSVGDQLDYSVTATNTGTGNLTNVVVSDDHAAGNQVCAVVTAGGFCQLGVNYTVTAADGRTGRVRNIGSATSNEVPGPLNDTVDTTIFAPPPTLAIISGDGQAGYGGTTTAPLVVELRDGFGAPMARATINWQGANFGTTLTDANGRSQNTVTFGGVSGFLDIVAQYLPGAVEVHFNLQSVSAHLGIVSGDNQSGPANTTLPNPLVVQAVDDVDPVGTSLSWTVNQGDAQVTPTANNTDGTTGEASATLSFGPTPGPVQVTVVRTDGSGESVVFNLASTVPLPVLSPTSGDNQDGLASTIADDPLVVTLVDGFGAPIANATVDWAIAGPGSLSSTSSLTNAAGQAQVQLTFGPGVGTLTVTASHVGAVAPVTFTAESVVATLGVASGDGQTAPINTTLPLPLVVAVVEPKGAPVGGGFGPQALDGVPVTFAVTSGGGSVSVTNAVTDASGHASTVFTLGPTPGVQTATATVAGGSSVTFSATATLVRTLVVVSGSGQGAAPGSTLPNPLVVRAQDNGADAPGVNISWTVVSGSGSVTPVTSTTDASGLAQTLAKLGPVPGTLTIRAARADDLTVFATFVATTAKLQLIPGLDDESLHLAIVLDEACETLAGMTSLTPEQADFLARCQDLVNASILDPDDTIHALDTLKPDLAIAMAESAFVAAQSQFQNLKLRIAALRAGTQGNGFNGLALNGPQGTVSLGSLVSALTADGDEPAKPGEIGGDFQRWGFFASGQVGRGEAEAGRNRPAYDYDINGITVGVDYRKSDTLIFGGALGYTRQDTGLDASDGEMDMSGWSVSGYGTWYRDNSWYTDAVITWGHNTFDLERSIRYTLPLPGGGTTTVDQTARSHSGGSLMEAAFTFGRDFQKGGWSIGPYGRLLYTKLAFDRIEDELDAGPGSGLGLEIDSRSLTSVASEIGAKFTFAHSTDWGVVTPHFQLEWEHEFKDDPKAMTARFLADPNGTPFVMAGEDLDTDYFRLSLGLSVIMSRGRSGFLLYERTISRDQFDQQNFGFGIRLEF